MYYPCKGIGYNPSLTYFKLAWKTAILLASITAKHSDFTLLHIDSQHLFLQHHKAILVPALWW